MWPGLAFYMDERQTEKLVESIALAEGQARQPDVVPCAYDHR